MKNYSIYILCALFFTVSCTKIEDLQDDPNRATSVSPDLLLTNIETKAFNNVSLNSALASRYLTFTDGINENQYYNWQQASFANYDNIKQVHKMIEESEKAETEVYSILAKFFNSYFITELTMVFGEVPYSEILATGEENYTPVYDTQEAIFLKVLNDLNDASNALATNEELILGDVIYDGDKTKWRKLINTYYLRVLLMLSNKTDVASLNVIGRFQEILENPTKYPLFDSNEDNGALVYVNIQDNRYPLFNNNELQTAYYLEESFVDRLKDLEDPRLFVFAEKTPAAIALADDDFNAYDGLYGSAIFSDNAAKAVAGNASRIAPRFYNDPINEPSLLIGYSELQFILAEAVARTWISGDAASYYNEGIKASMNFYGISEVSAYLAKSEVQLTSAIAMARIATQKHIALFLNTGWQMFYEQRRTGYPEFNVDGGGTLNEGRIPKRWLYPANEATNNAASLKAAINRQFTSGDDINSLMWLLK
ncbi:SusD/RagB family nutrient-binding outer membrane lipoprotein [Cellulophaga baltica]|uniref:Starch-binding associating with outer membrane n=1 Tax=Cellulophaga baltica TaxID=76594 RepID=A0A1G7ELK7_9FLAO|nr:SusD/RagB family nutrient-binding outer membrane lipoprotein [Cellulophaga baltica]SDE64316.1 Starch-binding associating with outer membrane [Cellulophaga baltica]